MASLPLFQQALFTTQVSTLESPMDTQPLSRPPPLSWKSLESTVMARFAAEPPSIANGRLVPVSTSKSWSVTYFELRTRIASRRPVLKTLAQPWAEVRVPRITSRCASLEAPVFTPSRLTEFG